ncbi:methylation-associated defense system DNA methyltransferase MAD2 [uncultured Thermomonospora sp.]|uniref:methylation-associated defense system DNA methyltransferase MAD2 n=1 Tax=uncultured Thermomonospora sp. TaxID=671175 RepID=UPI00259B14E8|nr:N-6 DNA methylase [uncultured Thermomonospora sp.]
MVEQLSLGEEESQEGQTSVEASESLADDEIIDFITGEPVKETGKEKVLQQVARALVVEYGISLEDMERDFPIRVELEGGRRRTRKADIAVFTHGAPHEERYVERVVICKAEPKNGNTVTRIRTHEQAEKDLAELKELMGSEQKPNIKYGLWTNGLDLFFLRKEISRYGPVYEPRANWPLADESISGQGMTSIARLRRGDADMLKLAFRRCHNYIFGNEGMPRDAAFWQFLYLLFCKMHDEEQSQLHGTPPRFFAGPEEPFTSDGRTAIRKRIEELFAEVKARYAQFTARDEIELSDRALAFIVAELAPYDLRGTDIDAKGIAYQELVGANLRGDRGQYFTPRGAVELMVSILDPKEHETVLDPACGTGGFLRETLRHLLRKWQREEGTEGRQDTREQLNAHQERLRAYAEKHLFGADFDPFLVRATRMNLMTLTGTSGNVYHMDSLAFPLGHLEGAKEAAKRIPLGETVDVLMTNPPFGVDIKITEPQVLDQYRDGVARQWSRNRRTGELELSDKPVSAVSPEQLFVQRAVEWVKPGGRIGIVLPNGILSNPGPNDEAVRKWILENCWVLASIELPVEAFLWEANVGILTTLLFLKRKTEEEKIAETYGPPKDYPVFMAVAEKVGVDRRGNVVYERHPDGEVKLQVTTREITVRGVKRTVTRKEKIVDNDLPKIAEAYRRFREVHEEPGSRR